MNKTHFETALVIAAAASLLVLSPLDVLAQSDGGLASYGAYQSNNFADGAFTGPICDLIGLVGGPFGALLTSAAVFTGLVATIGNGIQSIKSVVVVAVGAFGLSAGVSLYFGTFGCS